MTGKKVLVFGGTVEGRQVSDFLREKEVFHILCVATEYGEEVLTADRYLDIRQGRLNVMQMRELIRQEGFCAAVDATHPYAVEVSRNIREACDLENLRYLRYLRSGLTEEGKESEAVYVDSAAEAAMYLETQQGPIFLTTGSKELRAFTEHISDKSRLFARVLPAAQVIESCRALGLEGKQICGMQGPFSADINEAMMRQAGSRFLVTKDTGISGGFPEKVEAARRLGVQIVMIRRPQEEGCGWEEIRNTLVEIVKESTAYIGATDRVEPTKNAGVEAVTDVQTVGKPDPETDIETNLEVEIETNLGMAPAMEKRTISCIGIGMGTLDTLTHEGAERIRSADVLFGAKRILESVSRMPGLLPGADRRQEHTQGGVDGTYVSDVPDMVTEYSGSKIAAYLDRHPEYRRVVILMSGDVGFYSGARSIQEAFPGEAVHFCCGISSVIYFASRIPTPWQDAKLVSAHGKAFSVLNHVRRYPKLILLVGGPEDVEQICKELQHAGQGQIRVTVGTNLSYPEEKIEQGAPEDFLSCKTKGLHILMLENPDASYILTPGIPDEAFIRGKVPMTKEEIRVLSIAKLRLVEDAVVYDVGAGTGSVSVEIARLCTQGYVYAIEQKPEGIALIRENSRRMCLSNLIPVEGTAPRALEDLPVPTHAFIGGSSGNMRQIVACLLARNPQIRIVINTIALESIAEVMAVLKEFGIADADIVQVSAAKAKVLGRYHMMNAQNPVSIIAFGGNSSITF